jgi:hypothetical protein
MSKILIAKIIIICNNSSYTHIQNIECRSVFGNCVSDYHKFKNEADSFEKCLVKWKKVEHEIK